VRSGRGASLSQDTGRRAHRDQAGRGARVADWRPRDAPEGHLRASAELAVRSCPDCRDLGWARTEGISDLGGCASHADARLALELWIDDPRPAVRDVRLRPCRRLLYADRAEGSVSPQVDLPRAAWTRVCWRGGAASARPRPGGRR